MELKVDQKKIKELRLNKSWSQEELAQKAAVSLRTVQRMELDGSASLKSRRAIAEALEVEPAFLDPQHVEQAIEIKGQESVTPEETEKGFWKDLFTFPGPSSITRKIRTPLLITLWLCVMVTGGLVLLVAGTITILNILHPSDPFGFQILVASFPVFVIFVICLGLYRFFKGLGTKTSN